MQDSNEPNVAQLVVQVAQAAAELHVNQRLAEVPTMRDLIAIHVYSALVAQSVHQVHQPTLSEMAIDAFRHADALVAARAVNKMMKAAA